ncbi:MAG TPA: choice-of-anchor Q domain-containing protein, partial [Anaerolineales bacterium]|nr:choice-of-anchor Q domain-containing protein [Anaerolineales bacterium]
SGNSGGGIYNSGTLTMNNSTLSGNSNVGSSGGISNNGTVTVNNSTLSGNSAYFTGGGIRNFGTVTINNSTLSGNSALAGYGGGITNGGTTGILTVNNSTLSGNSAGTNGGGIFNNGTLTVSNSTLNGNSAGSGGGIFNGSGSFPLATLNRSLISGNSAPNGAEIFKSGGVINGNNYNVIGYDGSDRSDGFIPGPNDFIPPGPLDTVLDTTLADNGGPTLTHALVSGSVAIDAAPSDACLAPPINGIDQRGFPRNVDGDGSPSADECDAGAFEFAPRVRPTKTPTPTGMPQSTRTPTPRPTRTPAPLELNQGISSTTGSADESAQPLARLLVVTLLALGNLLLFRKWRM